MATGEDCFESFAHSLVRALDAWSECVGGVVSTGRPTRKVLVRVLEQERNTPMWAARAPIDGPLLSYWLRGRGQLLPGTKHNRLPGTEDSAAVARALKAQAPADAERLQAIGREISELVAMLQETAGRGWRRRIGESSFVQTGGTDALPLQRAEGGEMCTVTGPCMCLLLMCPLDTAWSRRRASSAGHSSSSRAAR